MRKRIKILKTLIEVALWLLFLLVPVGVAVWLMRSYPWWVAALSGAGVVLLLAMLINFVEIVVAAVSVQIRENKKKKQKYLN